MKLPLYLASIICDLTAVVLWLSTGDKTLCVSLLALGMCYYVAGGQRGIKEKLDELHKRYMK